MRDRLRNNGRGIVGYYDPIQADARLADANG